MPNYEDAFNRLVEAVRQLYYSAHWKADREVDEAGLWTAVRDAAGFIPGETQIVLGEPRWPSSS